MRVLVLILVLAAMAALLVSEADDSAATSVCHPTVATPVLRANLDHDRATEVVSASNVTCSHEYAYSIEDQCLHFKNTHWLAGRGFQEERKAIEANAVKRDGREFFYVLRRDRPPEIGNASLLHLVTVHPRTCTRPRYLFRYESSEPLLPPPAAAALVGFNVDVVQLSTRYQGLEIRLSETFKRGTDQLKRITLLRYSPRADRYVVYSPKL